MGKKYYKLISDRPSGGSVTWYDGPKESKALDRRAEMEGTNSHTNWRIETYTKTKGVKLV